MIVSFAKARSAFTWSTATSAMLPPESRIFPFPSGSSSVPARRADIFSDPVSATGSFMNAVRIAGLASAACAVMSILRLRKSTVPFADIVPSLWKALSSCNFILSRVSRPLLSRAFNAIWSYFTLLISSLYPQKSATVSASGPLNSSVPAASPLIGRSDRSIFRIF